MTDPQQKQPDYRALLKRSLVAIEQLEAKLAAVERARAEPIAIVGMGCRFPGGATSPAKYWELLRNGIDAVTEVPLDRWDAEAIYDPDPDALGKSYSKWGGFVDEVDRFDAGLFGISPREASAIDPQQRVLLETTWEALEHAAIAPSSLAGTRTAVFVGISSHDYAHEFTERAGFSSADAYAASGSSHAMAPGRLAYFLGLHGPNAPVDTACSASSVAIHLGVQSLRTGESSLALVAGVSLTLSPNGAILTSRARMMSFDGRCKSFDASADGYVRAEGCGVLVLKRLSDARRDGDRVLAVVRGTAVNQDGRSSGLTAPNGAAQEACIRDALAIARLAPDDIQVVEAHGTGTSLGDPIEMNALAKVFGDRDPARPLLVGSVKTNIGHTEGAAGIAGVIKAVLALQHKEVPAHLHFRRPNPIIPWSTIPIQVPTALTPWDVPAGTLRRIGVSSFGFSGTNTHVVLEEAPAAREPTTAPAPAPDTDQERLLVLSAQSPAALGDLAARYRDYLRAPDAAEWRDIAYTAGIGRSHLAERLAVVAPDAAAAAEGLDAFVAAPDDAGLPRGRTTSTAPEVAFLFTGQGAQHVGMARELYDTQPVFQAAVNACAAVADPILGRSLVGVMFGEEGAAGLLDDTAFTQPALFAVEYGLAQLWRAWGVEPAMVVGHSVGEYVAACVAGVFSLEDGVRLITHRGRLMSQLPRDGSMVAVFADRERVRQALAGRERDVSIGAVNGPTNVVISGRTTVVDEIVARLTADGVEWQRLNVSHAFHSPLMDPMLDEFERIASTVTYSAPRVGIVSNVTGRVAGNEIATAAYWRRHVRDAVLFADGVATVLAENIHTFVEVGPLATLSRMAQRCPGAERATWLPSLRKGRGDTASMLDTLGRLYVRGQPVEWAALAGAGARRVALPTYAFQRERYWHSYADHDARRRSAARGPAGRDTGHRLLGERVAGPLHVYQSVVDRGALDQALFPAAGFLELALAAARHALGADDVMLAGVTIHAPLTLPEQGDTTMQVIVTASAEGGHTVEVFSADLDVAPDEWRRHASATIDRADGAEPAAPPRTLPGEPTAQDVAAYYARLDARTASPGSAFRGIRELTRSGDQLVARVELPPEGDAAAAGLHVHPALLDAALQVVGAALATDTLYVPVSLEQFRVYRPSPREAWCHVTLGPVRAESNAVRVDVMLTDADDRPIADVRGLVLHHVSQATGVHPDWLYEVRWDVATARGQTPSGRWLLLADGDDDPLAAALAAGLANGGASVTTAPLAGALAKASDGTVWRGIVALVGTRHPGCGDDLACLKAAHESQIAALLAALPALGEAAAPLWLVTRGSQAVAGSVPALASAPAWGMGGVLANEYPALRAVRVDLDPVARDDEAKLLAATLGAADGEARVAFRDGVRYVGRLISGTLAVPGTRGDDAPDVRPDATYLVTGGLGGLGLLFARGLAERGARHLVLVGRRAPSDEARQAIAELEAQGVSVAVAAADIAVAADVDALLARVAASMPPLRGVLHAAGIVDDGMLAQQDLGRFARVLAPKVDGTWHLHAGTRDLPLDFFVLFSSAAALIGSPGQGNYAAANSFMDALAFVRRAEGRPALSVNWGSWAEVGMAAEVSEQHQRRWAEQGLLMIQPADGVRMLFDTIRDGSAPNVAIIAFDRAKLPKTLGPFFQHVIAAAPRRTGSSAGSAAKPAAQNAGPGLRQRVVDAPAGERSALVVAFLGEQLVRIMALGGSAQVRTDLSLMEMGLDSLMAMELRNRVQSALEVRVSVADLLAGPTVDQLTSIILEAMQLEQAAAAPAADGAAAGGVDALSDAEVEAALAELMGGKLP